MAQGNELERLEGFVAKILNEYNGLKEEKERLGKELRQKEEKIVSLEEELAAAREEKNNVGTRVKGLIRQIEAWESTLGEGEAKQGQSNESRVQRNLFSVGRSENSSGQQESELVE